MISLFPCMIVPFQGQIRSAYFLAQFRPYYVGLLNFWLRRKAVQPKVDSVSAAVMPDLDMD